MSASPQIWISANVNFTEVFSLENNKMLFYAHVEILVSGRSNTLSLSILWQIFMFAETDLQEFWIMQFSVSINLKLWNENKGQK